MVPPQDIKIRTVSSPTRTNADDGRSALFHIHQAMRSKGSVSPGTQDSNATWLGKVRSGEIRRVDYPDIIKAKPATPNDNRRKEEQCQSRGSFGNWLKYYAEDDNNNERYIGSSRSNSPELLTDHELDATPTTLGIYDRVTSIYDIYASLEDT